MLHCCHTLPPIDTYCVPWCNPGRRPRHNASVDVKVDQRVPDFVRNVLHHVKVMRMWLTMVADNNAESNGINDWSSVNIARVVVVPQLGGCGGLWRGNNAAQLTIFLACRCRCG